MYRTFFTLLALALLASCTPKANPGTDAAASDNTLTAQEQKDGWKLLFDGKTFNGWHKYGGKELGAAWMVEDNTMHLKVATKSSPSRAKDGGDIVTDNEYQDYELSLDWKISACGNSGLYYHVVEDAKYPNGWMTGPEMQVLDDTCHPDAKIIKHRAGDLYDMISCNPVTVKPAGEWNRARLVSKQGKIEHWLNGQKVVSFDMNTPAWPAMIAASKFKGYADFGKARKGRIALQDHGDLVWYKNIKIRTL